MDVGPSAAGEVGIVTGLVKEHSGWDVYNNESKKVDMELVKDWTASLNFLLLFAAIFAAVLTAFIIESKKLLQVDQTVIMVDVMIFFANSVANGTQNQYKLPEFQLHPFAVTINCLFFASLSASLVAALASVVALQWVADYDAAITRGGSSPEDRARRRQFRYAGVVAWKMGEIIAALPLLLYSSVILFFFGLILWMWVTNVIVGAVVAGGAAIAVLFYGTSTLVAVLFVSAPFRTPLSRWIYSLSCLPFSIIYTLAKTVQFHNLPTWLTNQHLNYTNSSKRVDLVVERKAELARDALVWLANQLNISPDSHRRLLLLVGELPTLKREYLPAFERKDAPWDIIFDLLGWRYLSLCHDGNMGEEEKRQMTILQQCQTVPGVRAKITPDNYNANRMTEAYWAQHCQIGGVPWSIGTPLPNRLLLLLRDLPNPIDHSLEEMEVLARLARWRNSTSKSPQVWDEFLSLAPSLHNTFLDSCLLTFSSFLRSQSWISWDQANRQRYILVVGKMLRMIANPNIRAHFSPEVVSSLIKAYEAILIGFGNTWAEGTCLSRPLRYGRTLLRSPPDQQEVHDVVTFLLAGQIDTHFPEVRARQVWEVVAMLWLSPSNPVPRRWESIKSRFETLEKWDRGTITNWLQQADRIPKITEILGHLARAQAADPGIGPLWRDNRLSKPNDPHFIDVLELFDRLMRQHPTSADHRTMIDLLCQDLELESPPDFDGYFNQSRIASLDRLRDPCLRILAQCASMDGLTKAIVLPDEYRAQRMDSLDRVERHLLRKYSEGHSSVLELQASLWPFYSDRTNMYKEALERPAVMYLLQRLFRHRVACVSCHDGVGHLAFHIIQIAHPRRYYIPFDLGIRSRRASPSMDLDLIILWQLCQGTALRPGAVVWHANVECFLELTKMLDQMKASQFALLSYICDVAIHYEGRGMWADDLAVISTGINTALQLPFQEESTMLLYSLASTMVRLHDALLCRGNGLLDERELASSQAINSSQLLTSGLAARVIFGSRNATAVACARGGGHGLPSIRHLAPYEG